MQWWQFGNTTRDALLTFQVGRYNETAGFFRKQAKNGCIADLIVTSWTFPSDV